MSELVLKEEVYAIVGAAIEVHREMGAGFLEAVYQEALQLEFERRAVPFEPLKELHFFYKGTRLVKTYLADFVCFGQIVVELKALAQLSGGV